MGFKQELVLSPLPPHAARAKLVQSSQAAFNNLHSPCSCRLCVTTSGEELGIYSFLTTIHKELLSLSLSSLEVLLYFKTIQTFFSDLTICVSI